MEVAGTKGANWIGVVQEVAVEIVAQKSATAVFRRWARWVLVKTERVVAGVRRFLNNLKMTWRPGGRFLSVRGKNENLSVKRPLFAGRFGQKKSKSELTHQALFIDLYPSSGTLQDGSFNPVFRWEKGPILSFHICRICLIYTVGKETAN